MTDGFNTGNHRTRAGDQTHVPLGPQIKAMVVQAVCHCIEGGVENHVTQERVGLVVWLLVNLLVDDRPLPDFAKECSSG